MGKFSKTIVDWNNSFKANFKGLLFPGWIQSGNKIKVDEASFAFEDLMKKKKIYEATEISLTLDLKL